MVLPFDSVEEQKLEAIADQLNELAEMIRRPGSNAPRTVAPNANGNGRDRFLSIAQHLYHMRRRRTACLGNGELFGEPAWDILLDLYIAHACGSPVSVTSACIGAAVPATTALRHLGQLYDEGLIVREQDRRDQRRIHVRLSKLGVERMEAYFDEIGDCFVDRFVQFAPATAMHATG